MVNNYQSDPTNNSQNELIGFKPEGCARIGCGNKGSRKLEVRYLKKWGLFCVDCAKFVIEKDLVLTESISLGIGDGRVVDMDTITVL